LKKENYINALTVGLEDLAKSDQFNVYNNDYKVYVEMPESTKADILIYDSYGRQIVNNQANSTPISLTQSGVYIIVLKTVSKTYLG
jgi:UDP-N-acetylmuramyl tripeptide synthase